MSPWLIAAVAAAVVLLALLAWSLVGDDPAPPTTEKPDEPTSSETSEPAAEPSEADMEEFIADYLATAPSSPETTYEMLTPRFQEASGGFEGYAGFWGSIESAELVEVTADPESMTVAYTVAYVTEDGESSSDRVMLRLAFRGGRYLIAAES